MAQTTTIEMRNISVEFPGVKALREADCRLEQGHVTALVGANGAGKSTLMKVLSGVYTHYTGQILVDGRPVEIKHPNDAKALGIETVYQEVDTVLVPDLTVAENIMMDYLVHGIGHGQFVNWKHLRRAAREVLEALDISMPVGQVVSTLSMAQKQMVVIARAVSRKCSFLILDEPTAPLSNSETEKLFALVRKLRDDGVGIIFISHRLDELAQICESLTVLRDGEVVAADRPLTRDTTIQSIVELMLGRAYDEKLDRSGRPLGEELLRAENLSERTGKVRDINLSVRGGEIVGIAGLVGAGKTELCKTLFGAYGPADGVLTVKGRPARFKKPQDAVRRGLAFIPEERRREGIVVGETVNHNLSIATLRRHLLPLDFVNRKSELEAARGKISDLGIKTPGPHQRIEYLSGGNQQKVTIGKWIDSDASVYIFDEPTKGIDVGAKQDVYKLIVELARAGKAVIYSSSEQSEIMQLTDRVYVMYNGRIQREFETGLVTEEQLILYSTGGSEA